MFDISGVKKNPWGLALFTVGILASGVSAVYLAVIEFVQIPKIGIEYIWYIVLILSIAYLIAVNIHMQMTKSTPLAGVKDFTYDDNGTLWHGNESAISFRSATFGSFLDALAEEIGIKRVSNVFLAAGRNAGVNFGKEFGRRIYPTELRKGGSHFDDLSSQKRLELWAEYDSSTGWGKLESQIMPDNITIFVKHPTLLKGNSGQAFSSFLGGYGESVINGILLNQQISVKYIDTKRHAEDQVELIFSKT